MVRKHIESIETKEEAPESQQEQEMLLNMGPQHPGTHGIIRFLLMLEGEVIVGCTPVIGYLHRGIEKILENRPIMGGIRYMDNVDYLSPMLNEIAYVGAVEQEIGIEAPRRAQYIRLLVGELQRIASHLVAVGSMAADISALRPPRGETYFAIEGSKGELVEVIQATMQPEHISLWLKQPERKKRNMG